VTGAVSDLLYLLRLVTVLAVIVGGTGWLVVHLPMHPLIVCLACIPWAWALLELLLP
jgi:hypothetical protein